MPGAIAACFRCAPAAAPLASGSAAGPSLVTSVYETHLGLVALSWSRTSVGLSLRAVLRLSSPLTPASSSASGAVYFGENPDEDTLAFRVRPRLLWWRRGSRRFTAGDHRVDLAWDLTRARFPSSGSPEPFSGFFFAVVVDGEMVLAAGDLSDKAYRKTGARPPPGPRSVLLSRREHIAMRDAGHGRGHRTWVNVRGKEREISVDLVSRCRGKDSVSTDKDRADVGMSVSLDGERVLHVRRLRWKFRGSERVDLGGDDRVQVSWDLHKWLFPPREPPPADAAAHTHAHAVFVFRFELGCGGEVPKAEEGIDFLPLHKNAPRTGTSSWRAYFQRWGQRDWSQTGSKGERKKKGRGGKLAMASSSSSASVTSSTASWASSSTVMEWASSEEAEMQRAMASRSSSTLGRASGDFFGLVVLFRFKFCCCSCCKCRFLVQFALCGIKLIPHFSQSETSSLWCCSGFAYGKEETILDC